MASRITIKINWSVVTSIVWLCWSFLFAVVLAIVPAYAQPDMVQTEDVTVNRNFSLLAHLPGYPTGALQVVDDIAYLGMGNELVALDLADPTQPVVMGHVAVPDLVPNFVPPRPLVVQDHIAYLATGSTLYAFDVSDPTHLQPITSHTFAGFITDLAAVGHRLFVGTYEGLWVIDVQNPQVLKILSADAVSRPILSLALQGSNLYVVANGLHILDIAAGGGAPRLRASLDLSGAYKVLPTPTRAYVLHGFMYGRITVVDTSNPAAPVVLGNHDYQGSYGQTLFSDAVVLHDHLIVVGSELQIIDFSDPAAAVVVRTLPLPADRIVRNLAVAGEKVYLMGEKLWIYDAATPGNLTLVGGYHATFYEANDLLVQDHYAFVADTQGFSVLDTSTPTMPQRIAVLTDTVGNLYRLADQQNVIYAAAVSWLYAIDVTDPLAPQATVVYTDRIGSSIYQVAAAENLVFVPENGNEESYLVILDATDPLHLQPVGRQKVPHLPNDFVAAGHYLYVIAGSNLQVIDVSAPSAPQVVAMYHDDIQSMDKLAVRGNLAYVSDGGDRINIIDLSDPTNLRSVGRYRYPSSWQARQPKWVVDLAVNGNYIYVLDQFHGLFVVNIANPATPFEAGRYSIDTETRSLAFSAGQIIVTQWQAGLSLLTFVPSVVTTTLDNRGGVLLAASDYVTYTFPPGFVETTTVVSHTTRYLDDLAASLPPLLAAQTGFMLTSNSAETTASIQLSEPYTIQVGYAEEQLGAILEETLALYAWNGTMWQRETTSSLDPVHNRVVAQPDKLTVWALLGQAHRVYLPLVKHKQ